MNLFNGALNGPLVVLVVMLLLSALLRWAFSEHTSPDLPDAQDADYGLLVAVATVRTTSTAEMLRTQLEERGVRSTTSGTTDGSGLHILVFRKDAPTAERVLSHLN